MAAFPVEDRSSCGTGGLAGLSFYVTMHFSTLHPVRLSKTRFLAGVQCLKRLYLEVHAPELAAAVDAERQIMLDMGKEVGEKARERFPGGQLIKESHRQTEAALHRTADLMRDVSVPAIYEGAFLWQHIVVRADILERVDGDRWRLIEVKAATKVKNGYLDDLAIQELVIRGAGYVLEQCCLMHVNTEYVYQGGEVDLSQLFTIVDVTAAVRQRRSQVIRQVRLMKTMLQRPEPPAIEPDDHCHTPYTCPFWDHCTSGKPARWIHRLPGSRQSIRQLAARGIETIDEIPVTVPLSLAQRRVKDNVEWISPDLLTHLQALEHPIHHLDFETMMPAVPIYANTRPYRPIPVQWSNHIEMEDGSIRHDEYLAEQASDPRRELTEALLRSLGDRGSICVYSEYERHVLLSLGELFPDLRGAIQRVVQRLWDLLSVIQQHYYHPAFNGSFSMKSVLPALIPDLSYSRLVIGHGALASATYKKMVFEETDLVERLRMATALREYCGRDTWGMVELRRILLAKAMHAYSTQARGSDS